MTDPVTPALPFTIDVTPTGITITDDAHPENTLTVAGADALLQLAWQCRQAAAACDERITTHTALARAAQRGVKVKVDHLGMTCRRGGMNGARREGGHWTFPLTAFEAWLAAYVPRGGKER